MYCTKCGKQLADGDRFCPSCGASVQDGPAETQTAYKAQVVQPVKDSVIAIILSVLIPGLGQIYAGKASRGLMILVASIAASVLVFALFSAAAMGKDLFLVCMAISVIGAIGLFALWIWNVCDAHSCVKSYNDHLTRNGRPPE